MEAQHARSRRKETYIDLVDISECQKLHEVDTPLATFTLRDERLRFTEPGGNFNLSQASTHPRLPQAAEEALVASLIFGVR